MDVPHGIAVDQAVVPFNLQFLLSQQKEIGFRFAFARHSSIHHDDSWAQRAEVLGFLRDNYNFLIINKIVQNPNHNSWYLFDFPSVCFSFIVARTPNRASITGGTTLTPELRLASKPRDRATAQVVCGSDRSFPPRPPAPRGPRHTPSWQSPPPSRSR